MNKSQNNQVKALDSGLKYVTNQLAEINHAMDQIIPTLNQAKVFLSLIMEHLDKTASGWDGGRIAQMRLRAEQLNKYYAVLQRVQQSANAPAQTKCELADELWALSGRLEVADVARDATLAVTLYMQAGNLAGAERVIKHLRDEDGKPVGKLTEENVLLIERRLEELKLKKEQEA